MGVGEKGCGVGENGWGWGRGDGGGEKGLEANPRRAKEGPGLWSGGGVVGGELHLDKDLFVDSGRGGPCRPHPTLASSAVFPVD